MKKILRCLLLVSFSLSSTSFSQGEESNNIKKAENHIQELGIKPNQVRILSAGVGDDSRGEYFGFNIEIEVQKPIMILKNKLPKGTTLVISDKSIRVIALPFHNKFKYKNITCEGRIFIKDSELCSCDTAGQLRLGRYRIPASAKVYYTNNSIYMVLIKNDSESEKYKFISGNFYRLNSNDNIEIVPSNDVDKFNCE